MTKQLSLFQSQPIVMELVHGDTVIASTDKDSDFYQFFKQAPTIAAMALMLGKRLS